MENHKALLLVLGVCGVCLTAWLLMPGSDDAGPSERERSEERDAVARPLRSTHADVTARYGLANTNFLPSDWSLEEAVGAAEERQRLSIREKTLRNRFESEKFRRMAEGATLIQPESGQAPRPAPEPKEKR